MFDTLPLQYNCIFFILTYRIIQGIRKTNQNILNEVPLVFTISFVKISLNPTSQAILLKGRTFNEVVVDQWS